ncbi:hypothetical protein HHX47_DHR4000427 [Lentinula edodes]|nr:hypothetical protein HHX47_DHR4000427 [Lentinula edodes]
MESEAKAAHKQARMEQADTFRGVHLDPNAHHWNEMEEDDDHFLDGVIEFGDGRQYKADTTEGPMPSACPPEVNTREPTTSSEEHPEAVRKEDRFADNFDRSWPRTKDVSTLTSDFAHLPASRAPHNISPSTSQSAHSPVEASRVLFNERSNRLEPYNNSRELGRSTQRSDSGFVRSPASATFNVSAAALEDIQKDLMQSAAARAKQRRQQEEGEREKEKERARRKAAEIEAGLVEEKEKAEQEKVKVEASSQHWWNLSSTKEAKVSAIIEEAVSSVQTKPASIPEKSHAMSFATPPPSALDHVESLTDLKVVDYSDLAEFMGVPEKIEEEQSKDLQVTHSETVSPSKSRRPVGSDFFDEESPSFIVSSTSTGRSDAGAWETNNEVPAVISVVDEKCSK